MITTLAVLAPIAWLAWWVAFSPLRIAGVGLVIIGTAHPAPSLWIVAVIAAGLVTFAAAIVWRALAASGGRLIVTTGQLDTRAGVAR
jgi:uncharacterized membrane-anchored protein YitT (DUF2179 family)